MNIKNLYVGQEIKNYKGMCQILDEEDRKGSPRERQIKDWGRYFKYHKIKQKYIIDEVYDVPLPKESKITKGNNSIYIKYIETILLHLLSQQKDQTLVCTKNFLLVALGITGQNYIDRKCRDKLVKSNEFKQHEIEEFDNRAYQILERILTSALKNLHRRCLLTWGKRLYVTKVDVITGELVTERATNDEIRNFDDIKYQTLKQIGIDEGKLDKYDSLRDIYFYNQVDKFYHILCDKLYDEFGWDDTCVYYELIYKKENVIDAIPRTEKQLDKILMENKRALNDKVITALNNHATSHYNFLLDKMNIEYSYICEINNVNPDDMPFDYSVTQCYIPNKSYINTQKEIAEKLIRIHTKVHP